MQKKFRVLTCKIVEMGMLVIIYVSKFLQVFLGVLYARIIDPSWLSIHFPQCIHGHKCTWTHDVVVCNAFVHSFLMNLVPCQNSNPFLRPEWFFLGFAIVFLVRMAQLWWVSPISSWDWTLSQVFTLLLSLQHHFLHIAFHFGVLFAADAIWEIFRVLLIQIDLQLYMLLQCVFYSCIFFLNSVFFPLSSLIFGKKLLLKLTMSRNKFCRFVNCWLT